MADTFRETVDDNSPRYYGGEWPRAAFLLSFALWPLGVVANGAALKALWHWFVVPAFGAPPIHTATAVGLICMMNLLAQSSLPSGQTFRRDFGQLIVAGFLRPFVVTLVGFAAYCIGR